MRAFYLVAAVLGAIVPYVFFIGFFGGAGLGLPSFVAALFVNGAAAGFTADLIISSVVFLTYVFSRRGGPNPWPFVALNLLIGLSCALPAYLYAGFQARERQAASV